MLEKGKNEAENEVETREMGDRKAKKNKKGKRR